jgi:hypothetical protein
MEENPEKEEFRSALEHFFFPPTRTEFADSFDERMNTVLKPFWPIAYAFINNLLAVLAVAGIPYLMASTGVVRRRYWMVYAAERIRSLKLAKTEEERDRWTLESTQKRVAAEEAEDAARDAQSRSVLQDLSDLLKSRDFAFAADELVRQSVVLTWGALEVLATDLFLEILNANPRKTEDLLADENTKKHYAPKDFVKALVEHDYDLSRHMGDVLLGQRRLDDIVAIRQVFAVLIPGNRDVNTSLNSDDLWRLNQDRNLILHRRATVDKAYLEKTGSKLPLDSVLRVSPDELEKYMVLVRDTGALLLSACKL